MKKQKVLFVSFFAVLLGLWGARDSQAQTNFVWTNALSANWSTNSLAWSNELNDATTPVSGGLSNWVISFNYNGATTAYSTTNNLGNTANNGFVLGQLNFNNTAAVTIYGSNLVFQKMNGGLLPTFNQYGPSNAVINVGVALSNNTTFGGTGTGSVFLNSNLFGPGSLTMNGANYTLIIAQTNYALGGQAINAGTLQIGNGAAAGAVTGNITNNAAGTLVFYRSDSFTLTNSLVGTGTNIFRGTGPTDYLLSGTNLGTGPIVMDMARVRLNSGAVNLGNITYFVATNGGQLLTSVSITNNSYIAGRGWPDGVGRLGAIRMTAGTYSGNINLLSNAAISAYGGAANVSGNISGNYELEIGLNDSFNVNGNRWLMFSGTNNTMSAVRITTNAVLLLANDNALGAAQLTFNGGFLGSTGIGVRTLANIVAVSNFFGTTGGTNLVFNGAVNMVGAGRNFVVSNMMTTINGPISNGTVLTNAGPGVLTLAGANTFSGGVILTGGELAYTLDGNLGGATAPILFSNGVLQVLGGVQHNLGAHPLNAASFNGGFDIASPFNAFVVSTNLSGTGRLTKSGPGFLTILAQQNYTGGTTVSNGTLRLRAGDNTLSTNGALTVIGGTLGLGGSTQTLTNTVSFQGGVVQNGTIIKAGSSSSNYDGRAGLIGANLQGNVGLSKTTSGLLILAGNNTYSGATLLTNGTVSIVQESNIGGASSAINFLGGSLQVQGTLITNLGTHVINWGSFSGGLDIASAANVFTVATNFSGAFPRLTKGGLGTLVLSGDNTAWTGPLTVNGGTVLLTGNNSGWTGGLTISNGMVKVGTGGTTGTLGSGTITNLSYIWLDRSDDLNFTNFRQVGTGTLYKANANTLTFTGSSTNLGSNVVASGTMVLTGTNVLNGVTVSGGAAGATLVISNGYTIMGNAVGTVVQSNTILGANSGDRSVLKIVGGDVRSYQTYVGAGTNSSAAIYQSGGTFSNSGGNGWVTLALGNIAGTSPQNNSYGYYNMSGGILVPVELEIGAGNFGLGGGNGVFEMSGGIMYQSGNFNISRQGSTPQYGVMLVNGGTVSITGNNAFLNQGSSTGSLAVLTLSGTGRFEAITNATNRGLQLDNANKANTSVVNLNQGGTLIVDNITAGNGMLGGTFLNFDGGTLIAGPGTVYSNNFVSNVGVYVYNNGALIDSSNNYVSIPANIMAPVGYGLTNIAFANGGTGYIGSPVVVINGGSGSGATAYAQVDLNPTDPLYGQITNILITSRGTGYAPGDELTVQLVGGGALTGAVLGTYSFGDNSSTTGGLYKMGSGMLTLNGTNTYRGGSIINNGVLNFATRAAIPTTNLITINDGGSLFGGGAYSNATAWLQSGLVNSNSAGGIALVSNESLDLGAIASGAYSNLSIGAATNTIIYTGTLTPAGGLVRLGGGVSTIAITNDGAISGANGLRVANGGTVYISGSNEFSGGTTLMTNTVLSIAGTNNIGGANTMLTINGGTLQVRGNTMTDFSGLTVNTTIPDVVGFDITSAGNIFTISSNLTVAGALTKLGAGMLVLGGANNFSNAVYVQRGEINIQNSGALAGPGSTVQVLPGGELQLQNDVTIPASEMLWLGGMGAFTNGAALRSVSGNNTWAGPIGLTANARINTDAGQLTLSGNITNNNMLWFGGASTSLVSGTMVGSGGLAKDGVGALILTGTNTFTGGITNYSGALVLDFSQSGGTSNQMLNNNALVMGQSYSGTNAALVVISKTGGSVTQTFSSVVINQGINQIIATNIGSGAATIHIQNPTMNNASVINFGVTNANARYITTAGTNAAGMLQAQWTMGGKDFTALANGSNLVAYTTYTNVPVGGQILTNTANSNSMVRITGNSSGNVTLNSSSAMIQALVVTNTGNTTVDFGGAANVLRIGGMSSSGVGGILQAQDAGTLTLGTAVNTGYLTAGNTNGAGYIFFYNYSANPMNVNAALVNNSPTAPLSVSIAGGVVNFYGTNNYAGATYVQGGTVTYNNSDVFSNTFNVYGGSVLFAPSASNLIANTFVIGGNVRVTNSAPLTVSAANYIALGGIFGSRATMVTTTNMIIGGQFQIAGNDNNNAAAAAYFYGGAGSTYMLGTNSATYVMNVGDGNYNYGYVRLTNGTLRGGPLANGSGLNIGMRGNGVFDMLGGTLMYTNGILTVMIGNNNVGNINGILNVQGGTLLYSNLYMNGGTGGSYAQMTVSGGAVGPLSSPTGSVNLMQGGNANNLSVLNLNGGSFTANQFKVVTSNGVSILNFNGGTLVAAPSTIYATNFLQGITQARIYSGGAIIDDNGNTLTINQNLQGVDGYGVTSVGLANGGTGYIGAPVVRLTGGNGTGATAIAQMDDVTGTITNILITSAGSGYLADDAVAVQLIGGGSLTPASVGTIQFSANLNNGELTKQGSGMLILGGTNTYGGDTTISAGILNMASGGSNVLNNVSGGGALVQSGRGTTLLAGSSTYAGGTTVSNGVLQFNASTAVPSTGLITNLVRGAVAFDFSGVQAQLSKVDPISSGAMAISANSITETVDFNAAALPNAFLGAVGTQTYDLSKHTPYVTGSWRLGGGGALIITNVIAGGDDVTVGGSGALVLAGGNTYNGATVVTDGGTLKGGAINAFSANSAITLSNAANMDLAGFNQAIPALSGVGQLGNSTTNFAMLSIGTNNASSVIGTFINGAVGLTKEGNGTVQLTNYNAYSGPTVINGGTLQLMATTNAGPGVAGLAESYTNVINIWQPTGLTPLGTIALYPRFAETNMTGLNVYPPVWPTNWPNNVTIGYTGYMMNNSGSNQTWTFAANIDDGTRLYIDGTNVLSINGNNTFYSNVVVSPGPHTIDYRMYNGTGGAGSYGIFGMGTGSNTIGFGVDFLGRNQGVLANYVIPTDNGYGNLFNTSPNVLPVSTVLSVDTAGTLDLNGAYQTLAGLQNGGTGGGLVTNTAGATPSGLYLVTAPGSNFSFSGNIQDAGAAANGITIYKYGAGTQTLAGVNTYSGGTLVQSGALIFAQSASIPANSNVMINAGGVVALDFASGIPTALSHINGASNGTVAITANSAGQDFDFNTANLSNVWFGALGSQAYTGTFTPFGGATVGTNRLTGGGGSLNFAPAIGNAQSVFVGGGMGGSVFFTNTLNTYSGGTTIGNQLTANPITLNISDDATLGAVPVNPSTNIVFTSTNGYLQVTNDVALAANRGVFVTNNAIGTLNATAGTTLTVNGMLVGSGQVASVGSGTLLLGNATNQLSYLNIASGRAAFSQPTVLMYTNTANINFITVGGITNGPFAGVAGSRATLVLTNNLSVPKLYVGIITNANGAVLQNGGVVNVGGFLGGQEALSLGINGGYGYYQLAGGGTLGIGQLGIGSQGNSAFGNNGVFDLIDGSLNVTNSGGWLILNWQKGNGVLNVYNGRVNTPALGNPVTMNYGGSSGAAFINVIGTNAMVDFAGTAGKQFEMMLASNIISVVNLNGGTTIVNRIQANTAGLSLINFDGGTLKANTSTTDFIRNVVVTIYDGGAIIDTTNNNITIGVPLLAPTNYGVASISLTDGGNGYIGAPVVQLLGGNGTGATAVAQMDLTVGSPTYGEITNFLVTSHGSGYMPNDQLAVQLSGGGAISTATVGTVSLALNNISGGLTKLGTGTLILASNNTYLGTTVISNGNFQIGSNSIAGDLAGNIVLASPSNWFGIARYDTFTNEFNFSTPNGAVTALVQNGAGLLVLTNPAINTFASTIISNGTVLFTSQSVIPTNYAGNTIGNVALANGGGVVADGAYSTVADWLNSGVITNNGAYGMVALSGNSSENINWTSVNGTYSNMYLGAAQGDTVTFNGTVTPVGTNYLIGGGGGTLVIANPSTFTDNAFTNRGLWVGTANGNSNSVVQVIGPQNYAGLTVVSNATLSVQADASLGYGNINLANNATLQITNTASLFQSIKNIALYSGGGAVQFDIGNGSTAMLFGAINNPATGTAILKQGGGTLILSNNTMQLGSAFLMRGGTTIVDGGAVLTNSTYMSLAQYGIDNASMIVRGNGQVLQGGSDFNVGDQGGYGVLTVQDGANLLLNWGSGNTYIGKVGTGTLNMNGGVMSVASMAVGNSGYAVGTNNLNGGLLIIRGSYMSKVAGVSGILNLNGGTLRAGNNFIVSNFNAAVIGTGGAFLDASNYTMTVQQALSGSGALTVSSSGTGVVVLNASNTYSGNSYANLGILRFDSVNSIGPGGPANTVTQRNLFANFGGTVAMGGSLTNMDYLLSRITNSSLGTVAWSVSLTSNVNLGANLLTNVSFGAVSGATITISSTITPVNQIYRLGGGGGTLVFTNNILTAGTNLVAFGGGSGGRLMFLNTNTWTRTDVNGGLVQYGQTNAMGSNVNVNFGGTIAMTNTLVDANILNQINTGSAGTLALVTSNGVALDLTAFQGLSVGAYGSGNVVNNGTITPNGTTYRLGGGGGTLMMTNVNMLTGGRNLVAFGSGSAGGLLLTTNNDFTGGTWIGPLGTATVNTASLGTGAITNNGILVYGSNGGMVSNTISGSGPVWVNGGTVTMVGANTYTNDTVIQNGGTLYLSNATGQAISGNLVMSRTGSGTGGTTTRMLAPNQMGSNAVLVLSQNSTASADIRYSMQGNSQVIGGLSGVQGLTGNLIVEAAVDGAANMPATLTINVAGGTNFYYGSSSAYMRDAAGGANSLLTIIKDGAGSQTFGGPQINYTGLTTVRAGILALSNTTTFNSALTINSGAALLLMTPGATTVNKTVITNNSNNGLSFSGGNAFTIGSVAGTGSFTLWSQSGGGVALTLGSNNLSSSFSGNIDDSGAGNYFQGSLTKVGFGTLILSGTNTYNGPTLVNNGILAADFGVGLPAANYLLVSNASLGSFTGTITNSLGIGAGQINILGGAAGFSAVNSNTLVSLGGVGTPTMLVWSNTTGFTPATFVLNDTNANVRLTMVNAIDFNGTNRQINVNSTNQGAFAAISGVLTNSGLTTGALTKAGPGTLILAGANVYDGNTTNSGGILAADFGVGLPANTALMLTNGGTLGSFTGVIINALGTGAGQINMPGGTSGFSAVDSNTVISIGGLGSPSTLVWNTPGFSNAVLVLNDSMANASLTLANSLNLNGGTRVINVNSTNVGATVFIVNGITNSTGTGALTKSGSGTLILQNGTNIYNGTTLVSGGTLTFDTTSSNSIRALTVAGGAAGARVNIYGPTTLNANNIVVGNAANDRSVLLITTNLSYAQLNLGGTSTTGAVYQIGGAVGATRNYIGYGANGYGYYNLAGGILTNTTWQDVGTQGIGLLYETGGTNYQTSSDAINTANGAGTGVVYFAGGAFIGSARIGNGWSGSGRGEITVASNANVLLSSANGYVILNNGGTTTNFLNLNGGVLQASKIYKGVAGGLSVVNFNGTTWRLAAGGTVMGTGAGGVGPADAAYVYAGGAIIDSSNFNATISQNLLTPLGQGVTSIPFSGTYSNYIGAPYVALTGGSGTGATAIALFDYTSGTVTGLVITSSGQSYLPSDTVTATLMGGGSTNRVLGTVSLGDVSSGGLVKNGIGTLSLGGANTYTNGTTINAGNLLFTSATALPATGNVLINYGGSLGVTNATSPFTSASNWLASARISTLSTGTLALAYNTPLAETNDFTGNGTLWLGAVSGMTVTNSAGIIPADSTTYNLGGGWGTLVITNDLTAGALNTFGGGSGGKVILGGANNFSGGITLGTNGVLQVNSLGALGGAPLIVVPYGGILAAGYAMDNTFLGTIDGSSSGTLALAVNNTNPLDFNTPALATASLGAAGTTTLYQDGALTPYGTTYRLGGGGGTLAITNQGALAGAGYNLIAFGGGTGGNLWLTGTNTFDGGTLIGSLGTAAVFTVSLGTGAITNNGVLMFSQTFNGTNNNVISGTGVLLATNTGLVTLGGDNSFSGGTLIGSNSWLYITHQNALGTGGIILTNSGVLRFGGNLTITNAVTLYGGDGVGKQSDWHGSLQSWTGTNIWAGPITMGTGGGRIDVESGSLLRITNGIIGITGVILQPQAGANLIVDTTPINLPGQGVTFTGGGTNLLNVGGNNFGSASLNWGSAVTKLGLDNALPIGASMTIGGGNAGDTSSPQFWLNGYNQTISTLTVSSSNQISLNKIVVGTNTLTVTGDMSVGMNTSNATTRLVVTGPGALVLNKQGGTVQIGLDRISSQSSGLAGNRVTNDMSTLGTFIANLGPTGRFLVGDPNMGPNAMGDLGGRSLVILATNSTIVAGALTVGESNQYQTIQAMLIGAGPSVINASTVTVGASQGGRASGLLAFNGSTGSLAISNAVGGRADMFVAATYVANTAAGLTGTVNLVGHRADLFLGNLLIGVASPGAIANTGERSGFFSFDQGQMDVSNLVLGARDGRITNAFITSYATMNFGGGTASVGQISMATNYNYMITGVGGSTNQNVNIATLNLTGGLMTVSNGITRGLGGGTNAANAAILNLAGATLDLLGSNIGAGGSNNVMVTLNASNGVLQNVGQLNGGSNLVKVGTGTLVLDGNNTYTGVTIASNGVLRLNSANALPGGIGLTGGSNLLQVSGGVIGLGAGDFTRAIGTGTANVQFTTNGGFAAYGADRIVNLNNDGSTLTWGTANFMPAGGTLILGATNADAMVTLQNALDLNNGHRTLQVDDGSAAIDATISGNILNTPATNNVVKTGAGTLQLTGNSTFGALQVSTGRVIQTGNLTLAGTNGTSLSALYLANGSSLTNSGSLTLTNGSGKLQLYGSAVLDNTGALTNNGNVMVLAEGGTLQPGNATFNNYAGSVFYQTKDTYLGLYYTGTINNAGTMLFTGGELAVGGETWVTNPSTNGVGTFNINGGLVSYTSAGLFRLGAGTNGNGTLNLNGGTLALNQGIVRDTGVGRNTRGYVNLNGGTLSGTVNNVTLLGTDLTAVTVQSNGAQFAVTSGYTNTISASLANGGGGGGLTMQGPGTLILSGTANAYTGNTVVSNGTLKLGANMALPSTTQLYADTLGSVDLAGWNQQVSGINGYKGTLNSSTGNGKLTVNFTDTQSFLGTVTGASTLTLTGGGTLEATVGSTFGASSALVVSNGSTLLMNGTHSGVISTYASSTNGGLGTISTLNVMNNGVYMPGATLGLGTQTVHDLTLNPGGLLSVGLTAASNGLARVDNTFAMTNALLQLNLANYSFSAGQTITLVDYTGATGFNPLDSAQWFTINDVGGTSNGVQWAQNTWVPINGGTSSNNFFKINYDDIANGGHAITLTSAIPEPGTASLIGLVGAAWLLRRIRRRRTQG